MDEHEQIFWKISSVKVAELDLPQGRLGQKKKVPKEAQEQEELFNMSRSFNSFKRSPALICSVSAFVIVYVVYGLLLVPNNYSSLGVRNRSSIASPPTNNVAAVATLSVRYTQEELERVMTSQEARRAVEPKDLINRLREIGLEVMEKDDSVVVDGGKQDSHEDLAKSSSSGLSSSQGTSDQEDGNETTAEEINRKIELDGGKMVLKGPEIEDGIIPGRPLPPECHAEPHTDYDGAAVRWGLTNPQESAADCCLACLDQARHAREGELRCNVWVYCPAEEGCFSPDIYEHKQFECWLKQSEKPRINFKGRYPPAYRESHPTCTEVVAWASGVISLA
ncbi:unnamed protein product [Calypogeia fissa]